MISFCTFVGSFDSSKLLRRVSKKARRTAAVKSRSVSNLSSNKTITGKQNMNFLTSQQIYLKHSRKNAGCSFVQEAAKIGLDLRLLFTTISCIMIHFILRAKINPLSSFSFTGKTRTV